MFNVVQAGDGEKQGAAHWGVPNQAAREFAFVPHRGWTRDISRRVSLNVATRVVVKFTGALPSDDRWHPSRVFLTGL